MRAWYLDNSIWQETSSLSQALGIGDFGKGTLAVIGSGGKTTAIFRLAEEFAAKELKVIVTTTTRMFREPGSLATTVEEAKELLEQQSIVIVGRSAEEGKIAGLEEEQAKELAKLADIVLVEADGSKHFPLKIPAAHEPVIPSGSDKIILVVGLSGIGARLSESCHRAERISELLDLTMEHIIESKDIVNMLQSGYLDKLLSARHQVLILLNQADDTKLRRTGEFIAGLLEPITCVISELNQE